MKGLRQRSRKLSCAAVTAVLLSSLAATSTHSYATTLVTPPAATLHVVNTSGNSGNWYSGAVPSGGGQDKPVLVFVQGLHSSASQWFQDGMYQYAYDAGYRTAFVQLADSDGTGGSIQTNGSILTKQLQAITSDYGVSLVDIICHSKGGDDTQAAIAYDGANRYINEVFELSTPNYGSQLADLSYSWWAGWLASLLGQRDAAVYDLQTSRMDSFRNQYDNTLGSTHVDFYTSSGTNHGAWFSSLWYGGAYLSAYGPNDGAVTVDSAHLPSWYSNHVWTDNPNNASITYNHTSIHQANNTWQFIQPYLETVYYASTNAESASTMQLARPHPASSPSGPKTWTSPAAIYRGGPFGGNAGPKEETFRVDTGTTNLSLGVLTAHANATTTLYGPNGKVIPISGQQYNSDGVFANAYSTDYMVNHPQPGTYRLSLSEPDNDAYLLVGEMQGVASPVVTSQISDVQPGGILPITIRIPGAKSDNSATGHVTVSRVSQTDSTIISQRSILANEAINDTWSLSVQVPTTPGVYNVSISLPALIHGGQAERSVTYSLTVGTNP
jgi:hypothetical protein